MHHILHLDTSGDHGFVALARDGGLISSRSFPDSRNQASLINILIDEVLKEAGLEPADLSALSVIGGPGSYTGLRIGLATAKGLCYALDKPLMMHNRLNLLALELLHTNGDAFAYYGTILPARQDEYFACLYNHQGRCLMQPVHLETEALHAVFLYQPMLCAGILMNPMQDIVGSSDVQFTDNERINMAYWLNASHNEFLRNNFVNLSTAEPFYLKQVYTHKKL